MNKLNAIITKDQSYHGLLFGLRLTKFTSHIINYSIYLIQNHKTKGYC